MAEQPIDVDRAAIVRLKDHALRRMNQLPQSRVNERCFWDGYVRAIEHVLDMESE
jgi:hypothetical protein